MQPSKGMENEEQKRDSSSEELPMNLTIRRGSLYEGEREIFHPPLRFEYVSIAGVFNQPQGDSWVTWGDLREEHRKIYIYCNSSDGRNTIYALDRAPFGKNIEYSLHDAISLPSYKIYEHVQDFCYVDHIRANRNDFFRPEHPDEKYVGLYGLLVLYSDRVSLVDIAKVTEIPLMDKNELDAAIKQARKEGYDNCSKQKLESVLERPCLSMSAYFPNMDINTLQQRGLSYENQTYSKRTYTIPLDDKLRALGIDPKPIAKRISQFHRIYSE